MSEVERSKFETANPVPFGVFWSDPDSRYMTTMVHLNCIEYQGKWAGWKSAKSELAALREELAEIKESLAYRGSLLNRTQMRAEAAEQRNAEQIVIIEKLRARRAKVARTATRLREEMSRLRKLIYTALHDSYGPVQDSVPMQPSLQQRLTEVEQKNDGLIELLREIKKCGLYSYTYGGPSIMEMLDAALKPTESGASE